MAGIDHTIIAFHNGKLMRSLIAEEGTSFRSLIPFEYSRDAELQGIKLDEFHDVDEDFSSNRIANVFIKKFGNWIDREQVGYLKDVNKEIVILNSLDCNAIFYADTKDTYILIGGYGHYRNSYTHFYGRGYGEEFERRMAKECFEWLCDQVLPFIIGEIDLLKNNRDAYDVFVKKLGYVNYYDMSEEEKEAYRNNPLIDYDD